MSISFRFDVIVNFPHPKLNSNPNSVTNPICKKTCNPPLCTWLSPYHNASIFPLNFNKKGVPQPQSKQKNNANANPIHVEVEYTASKKGIYEYTQRGAPELARVFRHSHSIETYPNSPSVCAVAPPPPRPARDHSAR